LIKSNENLLSLCPDLTKIQDINGNVVYKSEQSNLVLIGIDMRNTKLLETLLKSINQFSDFEPTLLISEVVLTYMGVNSCNSVVKWLNELFQNFILLVYEQINPFDGFGQVMCAHFKKLGSPLKCILKYPYEEDQIKRYVKIGFDNCFTIKASDFYRDFTNNEEKDRIDKLELFDEYEPWHLKCSHYILLMGTKGKFCSDLISNLLCSNNISFKNSGFEPRQEIMVENKLNIKPFPIKFGLRFGHTMCCLNSKLFVLGGFGEVANDTSGKHLRLHHIEIVDLKKMTLTILDPTVKLIGIYF
jgi:tRNA wybutosine-synthesizing protein 4